MGEKDLNLQKPKPPDLQSGPLPVTGYPPKKTAVMQPYDDILYERLANNYAKGSVPGLEPEPSFVLLSCNI